MDCDRRQRHQTLQSGLTRYRSAPSSYLASILSAGTADGGFGADDFAKLFNPRASSPETQRIFANFINTTDSTTQDNSSLPSLPTRRKPIAAEKPPRRPQRQRSSDYSSQLIYSSRISAAAETTYCRLPDPTEKEEVGGGGGVDGGNSGLLRHNSSPAGLFDRSIYMETSADRSGEDRGNNSYHIPKFPLSPWDDSTMLSDDFIKGLMDDGNKPFEKQEALDDQKNEFGNFPPFPLSHHLSLPESALENLVQDSLPCKLRAKRGFATHPRSIAERVRRNKISERTRKLQELVPNMEKQTNTADMLDLAVDYIKDLQRQVKMLSDNRATCTCPARMSS